VCDTDIDADGDVEAKGIVDTCVESVGVDGLLEGFEPGILGILVGAIGFES